MPPLRASCRAVVLGQHPAGARSELSVLSRCRKAGVAHFELETAGDVQENAIVIASAVDVGYTPPWPAGSGDLAFHDDRRLSDSDMDAILTWFIEGSALDVDADTPVESTSPELPALDGGVVMFGEPYKGSSAIRDDYRRQIYDRELTEPSFLQSYDFEADRTEIVHHVIA